jgi:peptidoglycan/LPS O-acetylase OafA/YrhL
MFGLFRYILSLIVVQGHLAPLFGKFQGVYAVFGFYALSGYLITLVVNQKYGFSLDGLKKFFINRILRLYPVYLILISFSISSSSLQLVFITINYYFSLY